MNCYLCRSDSFTVRKGSVRDYPSLKILECESCGLVMLDSFDHVHPGHYENSGMHGGAPISMEQWLNETEWDDQRRFEMLKAAIVNRKVLDFGCGAAGFLRKAVGLAAEAAGVELEQRVREYWSGTLQLYGSLDEVGGGYDLITAFHVVEHLQNPITLLEALASRLKDGGSLVIEVPSSEDALLTLYDNSAFQSFTYWSQHLFLFNADTLHLLAQKAGLHVVSIRQFQRYPISNHLHWLSKGLPGGHVKWSFLDNAALHEAYASALAAVGKCDTLIMYLERRNK